MLSSIAPAVTITDLGTLGSYESKARAINNAGQIVGNSRIANAVSDNAFLYSHGVMIDLGPASYSAYGINAIGQVVGNSNSSTAFLYAGGTTVDLGTLGGSYSTGTAINSAGQIAGSASGAGNNFEHAVVYYGGAKTDLGSLGGDTSGAYAINNSGDVVGYSYTQGNASVVGFLYTAAGGMTSLGSLGGNDTVAEAINDAGQIVGVSALSSEPPGLLGSAPQHAFSYWQGTMTDLGTLGGTNSIAMAINAGGLIVGTAQREDGQFYAFLYENGVMTDLNSLLPAGSGWQLGVASGINDFEQIVGWGASPSGLIHGFLLDLRDSCFHSPDRCRSLRPE